MFKSAFYPLLLLPLLMLSCQDDGPAGTTSPASSGNSGPVTDSEGVPEGYALVWNEEFDYEGLPDTSIWGYQVGGFGWTAKELQHYKDADPDNVSVGNGHLTITALQEDYQGNKFTSTRLVSKGKADFDQGYFEIRAQFPKGNGLRSAFWMVGDTVSKMGWPNAGEIDLVEHYGQFPNVINAAVQTQDAFWAKQGKGQLGGSTTLEGVEEDFHVYGCLWTDDALTFSVDGNPYWTYTRDYARETMGWPFQWPFYMVATLSVGGIRGPIGKYDAGAFPAEYKIDYVRVYQKE
ncbi:family 16 glycosylhydrolase [Lewinella sp. W8]|uniref:glycoside hydrolase family 16 protein n=1 Tax=Lewinella sp. W8 TaxID=2528208 RepID=UPI00106842E9|nr:glycoside hydrolase family 16 protein [Lewinella sp. W8]MTB51274.1 family 16 glycosylhydrolase [Lewinella sp. W8]